VGLQKEKIPAVPIGEGNAEAHLVAGKLKDAKGPVDSLTGIHIMDVKMKKGSSFKYFINTEHNVLFYVVKGKVNVNDSEVRMHQLVEFDHDHERISVSAYEDSLLLLGHAAPLNEPVVARGPFVMNTMAEIKQAYIDYQNGKMGNPDSFF
ncbi:MAG: pirin-like C-terminal cupin domain-containing protein, partial [Bacteroidales bacterium]